MLEWLPRLADDPLAVATARKHDSPVPVCVAQVPGTDTFVDYLVVDQFRTILIHAVANLSFDDLRQAMRRSNPPPLA